MKTIEEAANEAYRDRSIGDNQLFKEGVDFAQRWIAVEEKKLPEIQKDVLVRCRNKNKEGGIWLYDVCHIEDDTKTWNQKVRQNWESITHWRPIEFK